MTFERLKIGCFRKTIWARSPKIRAGAPAMLVMIFNNTLCLGSTDDQSSGFKLPIVANIAFQLVFLFVALFLPHWTKLCKLLTFFFHFFIYKLIHLKKRQDVSFVPCYLTPIYYYYTNIRWFIFVLFTDTSVLYANLNAHTFDVNVGISLVLLFWVWPRPTISYKPN